MPEEQSHVLGIGLEILSFDKFGIKTLKIVLKLLLPNAGRENDKSRQRTNNERVNKRL